MFLRFKVTRTLNILIYNAGRIFYSVSANTSASYRSSNLFYANDQCARRGVNFPSLMRPLRERHALTEFSIKEYVRIFYGNPNSSSPDISTNPFVDFNNEKVMYYSIYYLLALAEFIQLSSLALSLLATI